MILSFDKFERYEVPQVILCNPNSRAIEVDGKITITDAVGVLSNPKGTNLKLNFNAPHELSFDYYLHKSTDPIKQSFYDSIYEAIQTDRYIYLTDIGYFIISSVTDSDEDNIDKKSITCKSCEENELATAEGLSLDEKTYYLHTENNDGLLDLFLSKTAGWTRGYIDPSLLDNPRYVEKTEVDNGYNFLYTTIQDMFECIVEPDIIRRTVSVYSRVYYVEHHLTDIHIAKYNLLKHKTVEENDEDKYTALNVQGKDESLEIRTVNPTGKNVIYNFESRYSWMSPALQTAVAKWQEKCESVEDEYLTLQQGFYNDMQNIVLPLEEDIKVLELQLKQQQQTRDLIVIGEQDKAIDIVDSLPQTGKSDIFYFVPTTENNYEEYVWENDSWKYIDLIQVDDISDTTQQSALDVVNAAINNTNTELSTKQSTLEDEKNDIETNYSQPISDINSQCALETTDIFTMELRNELMTHIKPTDYVDEYMLVTESMTYPQRFEKAKELMDRAQSQLVKISSGQKTYSIDTRSFLFNKQFKHFSEQLCAGAIIYVETKSDKMEQLHLTGIDINFDEKSTNFTLGNKYDRSDLKALYEDTLGQNSKSFSELKYIASIIEDQQKQLDYQRNWVAGLRTLTLDNVLTSEDQAIEINNRGLTGRKRQLNEDGSWKTDKNDNPLFEPEQIKIINNNIVFTDDNWKTPTTAVGKIAVGYNPDNSVKYSYGINAQVLIGKLILGNSMTIVNSETDPTVQINNKGITILNNQKQNVFTADGDGNLELTGTIHAMYGDIGGWNILPHRLECDLTSSGGYRTGMQCINAPTGAAFYAGTTTPEGGSIASASASAFFVRNDGYLHASHANITGTITSTEGEIAGFTLSKNSLYTGTGSLLSNTNGIYVGVDGIRHVGKYGAVTITDGYIDYTTSDDTNITLHSNGISLNSRVKNNETTYCSVSFQRNGESYGSIDYTGIRGKDDSLLISFSDNQVFQTDVRNCKITGTETTFTCLNGNENNHWNCYVRSPNYYTTPTGNYTFLSAWQETSNGRDVTFEVEYNGDMTGQFQSTSDERLKYAITDLSDNYSLLFDKLRPVSFKYTNGESGRLHTGLIAQEVLSAIEYAGLSTMDFAAYVKKNINGDSGVNKNLDGYSLSLRYSEFIALLINEVQKLKTEKAQINERLSKIEATLGLS